MIKTATQVKASKILEEILSIGTGDNVAFRITKIERIMDGHEYEGIRFYIEGSIERLHQTIKLDVSTGDIITPSAVEYSFPLLLENRRISLWAYNIETLLAEKLETVLSRAEANTRMRDFYDIHVLTKQEKIDLNTVHLKEAFTATCKKRGVEVRKADFDDVLENIAEMPEMQTSWDNYRKNNPYVGELTWDDVIQSVLQLKALIDLL